MDVSIERLAGSGVALVQAEIGPDGLRLEVVPVVAKKGQDGFYATVGCPGCGLCFNATIPVVTDQPVAPTMNLLIPTMFMNMVKPFMRMIKDLKGGK